jgi:signal transduction histidine kinase
VPVNLRAQLAQVLEASREALADQIEIVGEPVTALGDPGRVRQIIRNLLTNAVRYGGDHIEVRMHTDRSIAYIQVCDDGPGVPEQDRETIFEPYHRSHTTPGQPGSVGLGLTVSRALARLMGGDLTYHYEDRGSIFEVALTAPNQSSSPDQSRIDVSDLSTDEQGLVVAAGREPRT